MSESKFKLPTGNTKYKLKPIKKVRGKYKEIDEQHLANFLFGPAKKHLMADISHEPVLTLDEQLFFENASLSGLGFNPGDLATNKPENNYWANPKNKISLDESGLNLDLSIPKDYLLYAILRSKKDLVAMHPDNLKGSKMKQTYKWVLEPEGYQAKAKADDYNVNREIFKFLGKIEDNKVEMINFLLEAEPKKFVSSSSTLDFLQGELNKLAKEKPSTFIKVMKDDDRGIKSTIKRALKAGAIKKDGISFVLDEGDVLGSSLNETIKFLKDPENQDVKDKIEIKIEKSKV